MKTIFTCVLFSIVLFASAQNTFKVRSFAPGYSDLSHLVQLNDGSFVSMGSILLDPNVQSVNFYLLKTGNTGKVLASKYISGYGNGEDYSLSKTNDGGFVICSYSGRNQAVVIKFKADLTLQWQKAYFISGARVRIHKALQTTDGSYLMVGEYLNNIIGSESHGYLLKTDSDGNVLFSKNYSNSGVAFIDVSITTDGNYALLSVPLVGEVTYDTCFLVKVNTAGSVLWSREIYGNKQNMEPHQLQTSSDGGLIITGESYPSDTAIGKNYMMMVKHTNDGSLAWSRSMTTGSSTENYAYSVIEDKDGGYLFAGGIDTYNSNGNYDSNYIYFVKTNASGNLQWTKTLDPTGGGNGYTVIYSFIITSDGGYAGAGEGYFLNTNSEDSADGSFIYKYDSNFLSCNDGSAGSRGSIQNYGSSAIITAIASDLTTSDSNLSVTLTEAGEIDNVCNGVLPLQLLSFKANLQNKSVAIEWTTANEVNTNYFEIQRSKDATAFSTFQQVAAKGNSNGVETYNVTDRQPLPGTSYYRLKEIDKNGAVTYSSVVPVTLLNNGAVIISPNPAKNVVRVVVQSETNSQIVCQLIDTKGNLLATQNASLAIGRNEINIPASALAKGVYLLKTIQNHSVQTLRFVKQ